MRIGNLVPKKDDKVILSPEEAAKLVELVEESASDKKSGENILQLKINSLKEHLNEEVLAVYMWNGIGKNTYTNFKEIKWGILEEVTDKDIFIKFTQGMTSYSCEFGEITGHRISFEDNKISKLEKITNVQGKLYYSSEWIKIILFYLLDGFINFLI